MSYDVGNPAEVKERKTKTELSREREIEELRQLLETYGGRSYIWRLLDMCGVYKTSFTGNSTTFFNEGRRDIGLRILEELFEASPNVYTLMRSEAIERDK